MDDVIGGSGRRQKAGSFKSDGESVNCMHGTMPIFLKLDKKIILFPVRELDSTLEFNV